MKSNKPYPLWPYYDEEEIDAVVSTLKSGKVNYWTGDSVRKFETEFADYCNCKYAIALANGTVSLELALIALGIKTGDEVIVPSRTFIATASAVVRCNATPVFADVDIESQNINLESIKKVVTERTRAIIVVHLAGWPCDMDSILDFAKDKGLRIIEDCAQSHGAKYKGKPVGSFGDFGSFSFCQDKIMSTGGEGGMLVTNNDMLWEKAWSYKDHGKDYKLMTEPYKGEGFRWVHESIGTNFRMTGMQAAIGCVQLKKLDSWIIKRRENAHYLFNEFKKIKGLKVIEPPKSIFHSYYKCYVFVELDKLKPEWTKERILTALNEEKVLVSGGSCSEVYHEHAFEKLNIFAKYKFNNSIALSETSLMFQVHPTLDNEDLEQVVLAVRLIMNTATN